MLVGGVWKGIYNSIEARLTNLEDKYVRTTRFATISSGTSGTVTLPPDSTVVLDDFGGTTDAVISGMSGGKPTFTAVLDASGILIATTFDSSGNYVLTGTPTAYPVAIIYRVQQQLVNFDSTSSDIIGVPEVDDQVWTRNGANIYFNTGNVGIGITNPSALLQLAGNKSAAAWTSNGIGFVANSATYTDTTSTGSPSIVIHSMAQPTVAATNAITPTLTTFRIAGPPNDGTNVTSSNKFSLLVASGSTRFSGLNLFGTNSGSPSSVIQIDGNQSSTSWTIGGRNLQVSNNTLTDTSGSGTITTRVGSSINNTTFASSNAVTLTQASNFYISGATSAGSNTTITNSNALQIASLAVSGSPTNTYGLNLAASSGGTNNYAATISGNVGMGGVTDPTAMLAIAANGATVGTNEQIELRSQRAAITSGNMLGGISFRSNDTNLTAPGTKVALISAIATATHTAAVLDTALTFSTTTGTTLSEEMRLTGAGFLGINTTSPVDLLHVSYPAATTLQLPIRIQNLEGAATSGAATGIGFKVESSTSDSQFKAGIAFERTASDGRGTLHFLQNNSSGSSSVSLSNSVMMIDRSGFVGVGTTAPGAKLEVLAGAVRSSRVAAQYVELYGGDSGSFTNTYVRSQQSEGNKKPLIISTLHDSSGTPGGSHYISFEMGAASAPVEVFRLLAAGNIIVPTTVTAGGTTGNQTINKISGTVNFAAAATSITVTNSLVSANSIVMAVVRTNDATATIKNVVPSAGSFVINLNAAATAETSVGFFVIN